MRQGAQGWCTGMTLRDGMGREEKPPFTISRWKPVNHIIFGDMFSSGCLRPCESSKPGLRGVAHRWCRLQPERKEAGRKAALCQARSSSGALRSWVRRELCGPAALPHFPLGIPEDTSLPLGRGAFHSPFALLVLCDLQALIHAHFASDTPLLSIAFPSFNDLSTQPRR